MAFIKGQSGNPAGREKGSKNIAARVRDEMIEIFNDLGGKEGYLTWLRADDKRKEQYYQKVLPQLVPKITELEQVSPYIIQVDMGENERQTGQDNQADADAEEIHIKSGNGEGADKCSG